MKNYLNKLVVLLSGLLASSATFATSVIDFGATNVVQAGTDITDTANGALAFVLPIIITIVAYKVGVRVFKSFSSSVG